MKEEIKTPEKQLNEMEISNVSDAEFKTLVIRMLKELNGDLNGTKKDPVRNEGYTTRNEEQFIVEWMKPRIKSMIWNIRKQKNNQSEQEEKRIKTKNKKRR